ncbi:MAG: lipopolysaccharide biosynthesis protein, partial [Solirubrobacteraceae bacterium]
GLLRSQLRQGALLSPYFVFLFLNLRLDVLLLAAFDTTRSVGIYAVAVIFAELIWLVTDAINAGARERQWGTGAEDALAATASAARMSLLIALLALPVIAVAAPLAIPTLFGAQFADATDALWALLPAAVAMAWWRALGAGLVRFGRARTVNAVAFTALAANVGLNVWLIPRLGISGAALASLGSYALGALLAAVALCRGRLSARELLPGRDDLRRLVTLLRAGLRPARARGNRA